MVGQLRLCFKKYCQALSSRLDMDECESNALAFYVFILFISVIEFIMTFQYVKVIAGLDMINLNEWIKTGLQIEYLAFFIPTRFLLVYTNLKRPIMKAYKKRSRFIISLTQIFYSIVPTEMISFFGQTDQSTEYSLLLLNISWLRRIFILVRISMECMGIWMLDNTLSSYAPSSLAQNDNLQLAAIALMNAGTMLATVCVLYAGFLLIAICPKNADYDANSAYRRYVL